MGAAPDSVEALRERVAEELEAEQWVAATEALEDLAVMTGDVNEQLDAMTKVAIIQVDALASIDAAVASYESVLDIEPTYLPALEGLAEIYADRENWRALVAVLGRQREAVVDPAAKLEVLRKLSLLQIEALQDKDAGIVTLRELLTLQPDDGAAEDSLRELLVATERWAEVAELDERRLDRAAAGDARHQALTDLAGLYADRLGDPQRAANTWRRLLDEAPGHEPALAALELLYRSAGDWNRVIDLLQEQAALTVDPGERAALLREQAVVAKRELDDIARAATLWMAAVDILPTDVESLDCLADLYASQQRWKDARSALERKLAAVTTDGERAQVRAAIAKVTRDSGGDATLVIAELEAAVEADPHAAEALEPLARAYMEASEWPKALPLLRLLTDELADDTPTERRVAIHLMLGRCAERTYDDAAAIEAFEKATELAKPDGAVLESLARLSARVGRHTEATRYYQQLIESEREWLGPEELHALCIAASDAARRAGQGAIAKLYQDEATLLKPSEASSFQHRIDQAQASGEWAEAVALQRQLLKLTADPAERGRLLLAVGDALHEHLQDLDGALTAYEAAMQLAGLGKAPLLHMLAIYAERHDVRGTIACLERLVEIEEDPDTRVRWTLAMAQAWRDLGDVRRSTATYEALLDTYPERLDLFEAVVLQLAGVKAWEALAAAYLRMLQRLHEPDVALDGVVAVRATLFKKLARLYETRVPNPDLRLQALEGALGEAPRDLEAREALAGLYETDQRYADAAGQWRAIYLGRPERHDALHRLVPLYERSGQSDAAFNAAGALGVLGAWTAAEQEFYRTFTSPHIRRGTTPMSMRQWLDFVAPRGWSPWIGQILALSFGAIGSWLTKQSPKDFGLSKKRMLASDAPLTLMPVLTATARLLNMAVPPVYTTDKVAGLAVVPARPAVLTVGPWLAGTNDELSVALAAARGLTLLMPAHAMLAYADDWKLEAVVGGALSLVDPSHQLTLPAELPLADRQRCARQAAEVRDRLGGVLHGEQRSRLAQAAEASREQGGLGSIQNFRRMAELAALRTGLVMCEDLVRVCELVRAQPRLPPGLDNEGVVKHLTRYALRDAYQALRQSLGVALVYE